MDNRQPRRSFPELLAAVEAGAVRAVRLRGVEYRPSLSENRREIVLSHLVSGTTRMVRSGSDLEGVEIER